jgi:hypothetical protein
VVARDVGVQVEPDALDAVVVRAVGREEVEDDTVAEVYTRKGVKVHYLTEEEFKAWEDLARRTAWKTFVEKVRNGKQLMEAALAVK